MAEDIEAQLATSLRREAALAGVLNAVAQGGDLDSVLTEIAYWAAELTRSSLGLVFVGDGEVGRDVHERPGARADARATSIR